MPSSSSFGRRAAPAAARVHAAAPPAWSALSPEAEAFRKELAGSAGETSEFERWRRSRRVGRWGAWALSFALTLPGALCFVAKAPAEMSAVLEIVGLGLGAWLRRARRRRIAEVAGWAPDAPA